MSLIDEIEKALKEATQGKWIDPWETQIDEDFEGIKSETGEVVLSVQWHDGDRLYLSKPNAHLFAHAPEWLRLLVERVRENTNTFDAVADHLDAVVGKLPLDFDEEIMKHLYMATHLARTAIKEST